MPVETRNMIKRDNEETDIALKDEILGAQDNPQLLLNLLEDMDHIVNARAINQDLIDALFTVVNNTSLDLTLRVEYQDFLSKIITKFRGFYEQVMLNYINARISDNVGLKATLINDLGEEITDFGQIIQENRVHINRCEDEIKDNDQNCIITHPSTINALGNFKEENKTCIKEMELNGKVMNEQNEMDTDASMD